VLCALKCDLREEDDEPKPTDDDPSPVPHREIIHYKQGLEVAKRIGALRYLECSAMRNRGVNEAFTEASRVALTVKPSGGGQSRRSSRCVVM